MSVLGNALLLGGDAGGGFLTQRSVRLRSSASAYFVRTMTTPTNANKWTWSGWVKRGTIGSGIINQIFAAGQANTFADFGSIEFGVDTLIIQYDINGTISWNITTNALFRDPSAWYHIVVAYDSTQATASNRVLLYVNGNQITSFSAATYPTQNTSMYINTVRGHAIGTAWLGATIGQYYDGYLTEINFIDGQALTPSAFGEYDSVRNTQWKPKAYTGTYGTNGFYLKFADNSAATAAAIGKDSSGNGNNWTPNAISLTAGATYDSMTDVPTLTSATAANYPTFSAIQTNSASALSGGNLILTGSGAYKSGYSTVPFPATGKWYWEGVFIAAANNLGFGAAAIGANPPNPLPNVGGIGITNGGIWYLDTSTGTSGHTGWSAATVVGMSWDSATNTFAYTVDGTTWNTVGSVSTTDGRVWGPAAWCFATGDQLTLNFGQRPFTYTPPTGFLALNAYNLPEPAVASSDDYHKVYTYTGNGGGLQVGEIQKPLSLYNLDRSLRLRASASAYLNRTPATNTNSQIATLAFWVKRGSLSSRQALFSWSGVSTANNHSIEFFSDDTIEIYAVGTAAAMDVKSTQIFKDPNLWTHIVYAIDTTQATAANRIKLYINGVQATAFGTATYPALNANLQINSNNAVNIGRRVDNTGASFFDGYMADIYWIDGQALDPTAFGQYDGNYYWTPKAYTGTYGNNGFHLEFEDFSASTAAAIGKDTSGQGNNWTPNNINLTTPANTNTSWDSMTDVPTLTSADVANFATLDPLTASNIGSGNLQVTGSGTGTVSDMHISTIPLPSTGKWYCEMSSTAYNASTIVGWIGVMSLDKNKFSGLQSRVTGAGAGYFSNDVLINNVNVGALNDVFGVAVDMDALTVRIYINGVIQATVCSIVPNVQMYLAYGTYTSGTGWVNFGQRPFRYSNYGTDRPAATFKSLNSFNVAEVTGDLESPDFVWIKSRSAGTDHALFNSVVGAGKYIRSSNTGVEVTDVNSLIQFNKNGFLLGNAAIVNASAATFVASAWKVAATTVTNTAGSITSQVRANQTAGISIVTWTGNNVNNSTIGHGFTSLTPKVIFAKRRDTTAANVIAMHSGLAADNNLFLSGTGLTQAISAISGGGVSTSVSTTTFTVKQGTTDQTNVNASGTTYLAYCFAEIAGFSKFTSYAANASSTDGPHVVCGFSPRWIMIKRATGVSGTGGWIMYDTARSAYNVMDEYLFAEGAAGKGTLAAIDVTANGFKIRSNNVHLNQTAGDIYIVMAFAEHPFKYSLAR